LIPVIPLFAGLEAPRATEPRELERSEVIRVRRLINNMSTVLMVAALLFWFATMLREDVRQELFNLIDIRVYQAGAQAFIEGRPLYEPVLGPLYFVYPPFAAILFLPMALVNDGLLKGLWLIASAALLSWVVTTVTKETRIRRFVTGTSVWKLSIALAVAVGPLFDTISLGQINLVILALVLADLVVLCSGRRPRTAGMLLGVAIAIKLTPLIFVVLLVLVARYRAAITATLTFAVTVLIGFVVKPADSTEFWAGAMGETERMGVTSILSNQSWTGALARQFDGHAPFGLWLLLAGLSGIIGLLAATLLWRRGHPVVAAGVLGLASCAVSPFSWGHHWVWFLLVLTWTAAMAIQHGIARQRTWIAYAGLALATFLLSTRYDVPEQGPSPTWALDAENLHGFWAMSYPILGSLVVVLFGALAWWWPSLFAYHLLRLRPAGSTGVRVTVTESADSDMDDPDEELTTKVAG
jgi:alpha-1,2-mannosyltransferase